MPKLPTNPPPDGNEFQIRPGVAPLGSVPWKGVNTSDDPGSLDPNEFQRAENVRIQGKNIGTRPGSELLFSLPALGTGLGAGQVMWMREAPVDNPHQRLWFSTIGCLGAFIPQGSTIANFDPSQSPGIQGYASFFANADRQSLMGVYGDTLNVGEGSALREIVQLTSATGVNLSDVTASPPNAPLAIFTGFTITCLQEFDNKLFVGMSNDAAPTTTSKIVVWDGISWQDDLTGLRVPQAFGIFQNTLVVGFDATGANIKWRPVGAAGTAWTNGFLTSPYGNAMQQVADKLYIASNTNLIHAWDGTNLTLVRTVANCDAGGTTGVSGLTLHNGLLYYVWGFTVTFATHIGRHDPDSTAANEWVDDYKDITLDLTNQGYSGATGIKRAKSIKSYRQQIYIGASHGWVCATKENDVQGTVEAIQTGATTVGFDIIQLLRYP